MIKLADGFFFGHFVIICAIAGLGTAQTVARGQQQQLLSVHTPNAWC
jgi:hypothetical protein